MSAVTKQFIEKIYAEIEALPDDAPENKIEVTAARLNGMNYQPILLVDAPDFLTFTKACLLKFVQTLVTEQNDLTKPHLTLLVYQFRLLQHLREDDPVAWDEVNELTEDD